MGTHCKALKPEPIVFSNGIPSICIRLFFGKHPWQAACAPFAVLFGEQNASVLDGPRLLRLFLPVSAQALLRSPGDLVVSPN